MNGKFDDLTQEEELLARGGLHVGAARKIQARTSVPFRAALERVHDYLQWLARIRSGAYIIEAKAEMEREAALRAAAGMAHYLSVVNDNLEPSIADVAVCAERFGAGSEQSQAARERLKMEIVNLVSRFDVRLTAE